MYYRAKRQYDPQLDVRDFAELAATISEEPPHGLAWTVVGLRRSVSVINNRSWRGG